jgi:F-type H+-transporting ATPase subunit a
LNRLVKWVIFIALVVFACYWMSNFVSLGKFPTVSLPAETVFSIGGENGFKVTSTLIATVIADIVLVLFALAATRKIRAGSPEAEVPRGSQNIFELLIDMLYSLCKSVAGSKALKIFPWMATIFLFVLFANWMELLPGIESIGLIEQAHEGTGFKAVPVIPGLVYTVDQNQPKQVEPGASAGETPAACDACVVVPFVRTATSDINTPLALALITMTMVQVFGVRALGIKYFAKFINLPALRKGGMGYMFFVVGFLELVSELARILSFTFRLLGNIFAGSVLLLVMTSLIPFFLPIPFLGLELFVGFIQALVFSMLALVFINMAMASHDEHAEAHH